MAEINPYLNFMGNTEEAFNFYKSVFGGEFKSLMRFKDMPEGANMPAADRDKIMYVSLPIGNSILMATDMLESMGHSLTTGNNYTISVTPANIDEANKLFNRLAAGGQVMVPFSKASWGAWFGMLVDKFGIQWMINYDESQQ